MKRLWVGAFLVLAACKGDPATPVPPPEPPPAPVVAGYAVEVIDLPDTIVQAGGLSESGLLAVGVEREGRLHVFRYQDGLLAEMELPDNSGGRVLGVSPAGHVVALIRIGDESQMVLWDVDGTRQVLRAPPASGAFDSPVSINAFGDVVAQLTARLTSGVIVRQGDLLELPHETAVQTMASDLNRRGQVVGASAVPTDSGETVVAVVWDNGVARELRSLRDGWAVAYAISDNGDIVGISGEGGLTRPVLWRDGTLRDLGVFPGENVQATLVNERGQIAGNTLWDESVTKAFLWEDGTGRDLGSLGGGGTVAAGLNADGDIAGWSRIAGGDCHAFIWRRGVMTDLGAAFDGETRALALNHGGDILMTIGGDGWRANRVVLLRPRRDLVGH